MNVHSYSLAFETWTFIHTLVNTMVFLCPCCNTGGYIYIICSVWLTFTACKKSRLGLKRGKKAQCVSNRCKELFKRKKYFGVRCTLTGSFFFLTRWFYFQLVSFFRTVRCDFINQANLWQRGRVSRTNNLLDQQIWTNLQWLLVWHSDDEDGLQSQVLRKRRPKTYYPVFIFVLRKWRPEVFIWVLQKRRPQVFVFVLRKRRPFIKSRKPVEHDARQSISLCLSCDGRPSTSIAQSMQAIVLSHHDHQQDRVTFHHAMRERPTKRVRDQINLLNLIEVLKYSDRSRNRTRELS